MHDVTKSGIPSQESDDPTAARELVPQVYEELRRLARQRLAKENPGQTLQATALVHEAYLRLAGNESSPQWQNRGHFFAAAAEAMRRILIENARRKHGPKQGGDLQRIDADLDLLAAKAPTLDVIALDEALARLADESPVRAELVKLRFYAGLTMSEAADVLNISLSTAERYWTYCRTWLYVRLNKGDTEASQGQPQSEQ